MRIDPNELFSKAATTSRARKVIQYPLIRILVAN
jgi:hypothetical protein